MTTQRVRIAVGTKLAYDGELVEIVEIHPSARGNEVLLRNSSGRLVRRVAVKELLASRSSVLPVGEFVLQPEEPGAEPLGPVLADLTPAERELVLQRAAHIRELLTGYQSGSPELAKQGEPRPEFEPVGPLRRRYEAKAAELDVTTRTLERWTAAYRRDGEAGLAQTLSGPSAKVDPRWIEAALEVMVEHTDQSRPSRTIVIRRANARVAVRFGANEVACPSRATAFRVLEGLERQHPTFRLSTKRNRDIADRPEGVYGKLRPTRPGEYLLMDTTRLDVFALDPVTLRWVQAELTVGMDWYTRCITGVRITPVSTKSVDAAATLYQAYRPPPAGRDWPAHAVWPEHGVPRSVLIDRSAIEGPITGASGPTIVPETIVVDHGKIYVSEHLTSVCQRLGISIQPARLRTGRDKGPVERFFRTVREDLLQALPGYKGPDVHSRGLDPESEAFFYLDELEAIVREWVAVVYHHRPHDGLVDPHVPGLRMSPAAMFEHGMTRAGYIEVPPNPDLAYQFLKTVWRTIQHYGIEINHRRYNGEGLNGYRDKPSRFRGAADDQWPIQVDPDDISRAYFYNDDKKKWYVLKWEHAPSLQMPFSEDALQFARRLAATKYTYPDDEIALTDLFERWSLGLGTTRTERRMALRLARETSTFGDGIAPSVDEEKVTDLSSVAAVVEAPDDDPASTSADDVNEAASPGSQPPRRRVRRGPLVAGQDHADLADVADDQDENDRRRGEESPHSELGDDDEIDEDAFYADALDDV